MISGLEAPNFRNSIAKKLQENMIERCSAVLLVFTSLVASVFSSQWRIKSRTEPTQPWRLVLGEGKLNFDPTSIFLTNGGIFPSGTLYP